MDDKLIGPSIGAFTAVLLGVTFAAMTAALGGVREPFLKAVVEANGPFSAQAARLLRDQPKIEARMLVGRVMSLASAAVLAAEVVFEVFSVPGGLFTALGIAFVYGALAEVVTTLARRRAESIALPMLKFLRPLELLTTPIAIPLAALGAWVDRIYPAARAAPPERAVTLGVEEVIEQGEQTGTITEEHAELIRSVLEFKDTVAREVMVPRTRMIAIDIRMPLEAISKLVLDEGHSRYPVYRDRIDHVEGILCAKDFFRVLNERGKDGFDLMSVVRKPAFFAPESQKISALLREMQQRRAHLAVVVDEFGGTSGIVTLEDIMEEIVGEIRDEHDTEDARVTEIEPGRYLADAEVSVSDIEHIIGEDLKSTERGYDSIGGMIMELAGKVPTVGESVEVGPFELIVRESEPRRITRVEIRKQTPPPPAPSESEVSA